MPDDFFQDGTGVEPVVEKIKLGDEEYSQDELQKLVGLGKIGLEAEEKYKTPIGKVWPKYQQVINENKELRDAEVKRQSDEESRKTQQEIAANPNRQLTPDEMKKEALRQAEELGIGPDSIRNTVMQVIQGQQLLQDINGVISSMKADGLPDTNVDDVIQHMQETGIRNPEKAYKDMFEKEWIADQTRKLQSIKSPGLSTITSSTAGSKQPKDLKITNENFDKLFAAAMNGEAVN